METLTLKDLAVPLIKSIDSFNYLLKSHHRRVAIISYYIGKELNLNSEDLIELIIAASLHDIGALSVQERDKLILEDVINPSPHCIMGYKMLCSFEVFENIAQIIKYHHIKYKDKVDDLNYLSYIVHLADRVDIIIISPDEFILNQKNRVIEKISQKTGKIFHPEVFEAFKKAAKADIFWIDINNMSLEQLFRKVDFSLNYDLDIDGILDFSLTISKIIDFRCKFTAAHSYTTAQLAYNIGSFLGYTEEKCKKLKIAGYLHDVGKIGVPPELIEKNGSLSEEEFNLVKLHAYYTGQILSELNNSKWFEEIVYWAQHHHEKNDGSGYPYSLVESQLNEGIKILELSDIITALMEERPYRKGMSVEKAFNVIEETIAEKISIDIFEIIKKHKREISEIILKCKTDKFEEYKLVQEEREEFIMA